MILQGQQALFQGVPHLLPQGFLAALHLAVQFVFKGPTLPGQVVQEPLPPAGEFLLELQLRQPDGFVPELVQELLDASTPSKPWPSAGSIRSRIAFAMANSVSLVYPPCSTSILGYSRDTRKNRT